MTEERENECNQYLEKEESYVMEDQPKIQITQDNILDPEAFFNEHPEHFPQNVPNKLRASVKGDPSYFYFSRR